MRIGILTWYFSYNYGARAHSYALMKILEQMGHECEFINYKPHKAMKIQLLTNLNFNNRKRHLLLLCRCGLRYINFQRRLNLYNISKKIKSAYQIENLKYDLVILGSDEILNVEHPLFDKIYYGVNINNNLLCLYAPSSGQTNEFMQLDLSIQMSLQRCIALSARDFHTKKLLEMNSGKVVQNVLDPTLLYNFSDIHSKWKERNYLLIYSFDPLNKYADKIIKYARTNNLNIISVGRYSKIADKSYDMATFDCWIESFRYANVVVTDSFHGTVFAIKNKKQFVICSRSDKINKINDLLEELKINKRFYDGSSNLNSYLKNNVDYDSVYAILEQKKRKSIKYLHDICSIVEKRN